MDWMILGEMSCFWLKLIFINVNLSVNRLSKLEREASHIFRQTKNPVDVLKQDLLVSD